MFLYFVPHYAFQPTQAVCKFDIHLFFWRKVCNPILIFALIYVVVRLSMQFDFFPRKECVNIAYFRFQFVSQFLRNEKPSATIQKEVIAILKSLKVL